MARYTLHPPKPSCSPLASLVHKLRSGDQSVVEEIAHRHMETVQRAAGPYINKWPKHRESWVAVAFEGMMVAINNAYKGGLYDNNITPYISSRVQHSLRDYQEKMLKTVYVSRYMHNKTGDNTSVSSLDVLKSDYLEGHYSQDDERTIEDLMDTLHIQEMDKKIIRLRLKGYTFDEIALELGVSNATPKVRLFRLQPKVRRAILEGVW